ncbi:glutathione S-transferase [Aspergillus japonicus CBS 114.51]|uniref:Glutathione S-transferase n=2 Tax=Aspergillus TaxID=5052 RepID=A0A2V5II45_ASPV1|nr:glutathione S-transferase [Aspergillus japonicus CBS 114.51]PYI23587.1 glutathione S-transferase [Aspergillus violaceofuscus CBS 115571]RAH84979.1 glutathione S-transferase [Aspergillus japonicus CBS 114.51]
MAESPELIIHHLRLSQSDRVIWLCEELGLPYQLQCYDRDPVTSFAPAAYRALHPVGTAPVIQDGSTVTLGETNAVFEYLLAKYDPQGQLSLPPTHPNYPDYVFWLHHTNGGIQPALNDLMFARMAALPADTPATQVMQGRLDRSLAAMEAQLARYPFIAGETFTAADCMLLFPLTTFRIFMPYSLEAYPHIVSYLGRIGERRALVVAMEKGDPGLKRPMGAEGAVADEEGPQKA